MACLKDKCCAQVAACNLACIAAENCIADGGPCEGVDDGVACVTQKCNAGEGVETHAAMWDCSDEQCSKECAPEPPPPTPAPRPPAPPAPAADKCYPPDTTTVCTCGDGSSGVQHCNAAVGWSSCQCAAPSSCTPGNSTPCTCADGQAGGKLCSPSGKLGSCVCGSRSPSGPCSIGSRRSCTCPGGQTGVTICNGKGYEPCAC